ncbi:hypothetical protein EVAR_79317_1 [Eumeta japonica]|uniref:Uncharacterized protein n=1 Tax=Eumeta variegata TaxID=151549 RepID=A0A4C1TI53_EUMVA|nr:hypothetical protein EVAR_79317_1 [Eumeta japonica]
MSEIQNLMMEPEGSDDGARRLEPELTYHNGYILTVFGLTLKITHGERASQDDSNKLKNNWDMLFRYGVPVPTFWLHHQIRPITPYYCNVIGPR